MRLGLISVSLFYRVGSSGSFVRQAFFGGEMSNADLFSAKRLFAIKLYDVSLPYICCWVYKDEVACNQAHSVIFGKFWPEE